jgi:voltage-gated potassium channel Kch
MAKRVAYEKFWWLHILCSFAPVILILSRPGLLTLLLGLPIIVGLYFVFIMFVSWRPTYYGLSGLVKLPELIFWQCYYVALIIISFASLFASSGILNSDGVIVKDFVSSIYFSIVTFTTLGYGDFKPTEEIRFFAATEALLGYLSMGILVATVAAVLHRINNSGRNVEEHE